MAKLTAKQERFCQEYVIDLNATQAAIRAGYSRKTAPAQSSRLLTNVKVQARISELNQERQDETGITAKRVIEELGKIAFSNVKELFMVDNKLMDIQQMDDDVSAAISSVKSMEEYQADGTFIGYNKEIKLWDKMRALDALGKHFGIFEKDNSQNKTEATVIISLGSGVKPDE